MLSTKAVLNVQEAAQLLGVHIETIRRLARNGEIPAFKVGRGWRIRIDALLKWADTQQVDPPQNTVLVIDDDEAVRKTIRRFLEKRNYYVYEAANGAEGLTCLEAQSVGLVILDLKMPFTTGPEFLKEARSRHANLPVIIMTGYPDSDLMAEATQYGPFTLLAKPVDPLHLLQTVRTLITGAGRVRVDNESMLAEPERK